MHGNISTKNAIMISRSKKGFFVMKKRYVLLCMLVLLMGIVLTGCNKQTSDNSTSATESGEILSGKHHISIEVENYGTISAELDADVAPITVTNFVNLAKSGFYDGLTFHRIIDGFMIQGGDPDGNGTGGSDEKIKGEFRLNGVENNISHVRGTISMARSSSYNSASSQFFIMQKDTPSLDGQYAAFGKVTDGMDIVDKICKDAKDSNQNGVITDKSKQPVITKIRVID